MQVVSLYYLGTGPRFCKSNKYPVETDVSSWLTSLKRNYVCAFYFLNLYGRRIVNHSHILEFTKVWFSNKTSGEEIFIFVRKLFPRFDGSRCKSKRQARNFSGPVGSPMAPPLVVLVIFTLE